MGFRAARSASRDHCVAEPHSGLIDDLVPPARRAGGQGAAKRGKAIVVLILNR
jgi:hypothetical protein